MESKLVANIKIRTLVFFTVLTLTLTSASLNAEPYRPDWPHNSSDLKPDPDVTYGRLANGMRYAILENHTPADSLSMRLVIDAGSIQETDAQQGIAHLLEHMAFRGSKRVADGDTVKTLERIGLRFGADTNASTSATQTVYQFDLPKSDSDTLDTGLMLLREIASELNITDDALETERNIVLSEFRLSVNTPQGRAAIANLSAMLPGQRASMRMPIGKAEMVENASSQLVRSYYQAYYQPQRATLIVVGNIKPAQLEKKIKSLFANWQAPKTPTENPDFGALKMQPLTAKTHFEPGLPTQISVTWLAPFDPTAENRASNKASYIRSIGLAVINERLQQAALSNQAPFVAARTQYASNMIRSARLSRLDIIAKEDQPFTALTTAREILDQVLTRGVTQAEVDRFAANIGTQLRNQLNGADTQQTPALADRMVMSLDTNQIFENAAQRFHDGSAAMAGLKADTVTQVLRQTFQGSGPVLFMTAAAPIADAETQLTKAFLEKQSAETASPDADTKTQPQTWTYTDFGKPGQVLSQSKSEQLDTTFVSFANGVKLAVKQTAFSKGQVLVSVKISDEAGGGIIRLPSEHSSLKVLLPALILGGLEDMDFSQVQKVLAGKSVGLQPMLLEGHLVLNGATTAEDLQTQLQFAGAYLTEPALDVSAMEQIRQATLTQLRQIASQPRAVLSLRANYELHGADNRWAPPSEDDLKSLDIKDLQEWLWPLLKSGSVEVTVVGDVTPERAIEATTATLAAMPNRPTPTIDFKTNSTIKFPQATAEPLLLRHRGGEDKAAVAVAWPGPDRRTSLKDYTHATLLNGVLRNRLIEAVRGELGAAYSPGSSYEGSWFLPDYGYFMAMSDAKPDQVQVVFDAMTKIAQDLRNKPISDDEFNRVAEPMAEGMKRAFQNNAAWLFMLVPPDFYPPMPESLLKSREVVLAATPKDLQLLAQKYLRDDNAWKSAVIPE